MARIITEAQEKIDNYFALYLAIMKEISVSQALLQMGIKRQIHRDKTRYNTSYEATEDEIKHAIKLKTQGSSWEEIGKINDMSAGAIYLRVKRYMGDDWENRPW